MELNINYEQSVECRIILLIVNVERYCRGSAGKELKTE